MAKSVPVIVKHRTLSAGAAALLVVMAMPAVAQDLQGPPDGFRPPLDDRPPAQGPADNGIPPLAPAPRPQPRPAEPPLPAARPEPIAPTNARPALPTPPRSRSASGEVSSAVNRQANRPPLASVNPPVAEQTAPPMIPDAGPAAELPTTSASVSAPDKAASVTSNAAAPALPWRQPVWPWATALLLLLAGLTAWMLRRRNLSLQNTRDAPVRDEPPKPAPSPAMPPTPLRPVAPPAPQPQPRPSPAPPPVMDPRPVAAGRARLSLTLRVDAIEMTVDAARFSFTLLLANSGDIDATGGLVRIALQQAHPQQAPMLERFFDGAGGSILAEDVMIAAGDVGSIVRHAVLPLSSVEPMLIGGYPSLVPVIGFDTSYHWDGEADAFGQVAAAFVIGTTAAADGRVAPVRLDHGPRLLTNPVARVTAMQRMI